MLRLLILWLSLLLVVDGYGGEDELHMQSDGSSGSTRALRLGNRWDEFEVGGTGRHLSTEDLEWHPGKEGYFTTDYGPPYYQHIPWDFSPRQPTVLLTPERFTIPFQLVDGVAKTMQRGMPGEVLVYQFDAGPNMFVKCYIEHEGRSSCIEEVTTTRNRQTVTICINPDMPFQDMTILCRKQNGGTPPSSPTDPSIAPASPTTRQPSTPNPASPTVPPTPRPTRARFPTASPTVDCGFELFGIRVGAENGYLSQFTRLFGWN